MGFAPSLANGSGAQSGSFISRLIGADSTAQGASQNAGLYGVAGPGLSAAGNIFGAVGDAQAAAYQQQVARTNTKLLIQSAREAESSGTYAETQQRIATGRLVASQKAAQAANGADVNVGSAVDVRDSSQREGDADAAMIHYNALREAFGLKVQAVGQDSMAGMYGRSSQLALLGGAFKAGSTLISGASSLGQKWSAYKQSGLRASK